MASEFDIRQCQWHTSVIALFKLSLSKPRKVPGQSDPKAQVDFSESYRKVRESMGQNDHLVFIDGVHPQHNRLVM